MLSHRFFNSVLSSIPSCSIAASIFIVFVDVFVTGDANSVCAKGGYLTLKHLNLL
jgi:hypothetical protein